MRIKLSLVSKTVAAAVLVAAILAPAGAAGSTSARVKLAVIALPKSAIGSVAKPLPLSHFSGPVSNATAADRVWFAAMTASSFKKMGRVSGYALDYGVAASGGSGVTDVQTSVEQYKTSKAAKHGLDFWRVQDMFVGLLDQGSFSVTNTALKVPKVGQARFAYLTSYGAPDIVPFSTVDVRVIEGKYVLQAQVSARTAAMAKSLAPKLAAKLDARLKLALKGRLHTQLVKLPPPLKAAPPAGGPSLSALAATTSDLSGTATVKWHGYAIDPAAISCYEVDMSPAGPFDSLYHYVEWYPTANQAAFETDWYTAYFSDESSDTIDLSSIGHGAHGVIGHYPFGDEGVFTLNVGQVAEFVVVDSEYSAPAADMQNLAQTLADRLDTVYTG
jgi:hypothetical protein